MIKYDTGTWNVAFAFTLTGSVFPKAFVWAFPASLIAATLNYVLKEYEESSDSSGAGDVGTNVLSGFTFILGFLIVFRSQVAYSRWWEGGTLLQQVRGEWFNAYSSLMAFCNTSNIKKDKVLRFQHKLVRLISLLYASALQQLGNECMVKKNFELIAIAGFDPESIAFLEGSSDRCEVVLQWIQREIVHANNSDVIKIAPPILARVYNQLGNGIVGLNNARKIAEYNIPFCLAQMITVMLLIHWLMTPIICATTVQTPQWAGMLTFIVIFSFWSINYIATELEIPYGDEPNDLPMAHMQEDLNRSLKRLLHDLAREPPDFDYNADWHGKLVTEVVDMDGSLVDEASVSFPPLEKDLEEKKQIIPRDIATPEPRSVATPGVSLEAVKSSPAAFTGPRDSAPPKDQQSTLPGLTPPRASAWSDSKPRAPEGVLPPGETRNPPTMPAIPAQGPFPTADDLFPVLERWAVKKKDMDDLTGITSVMDICGADLVQLTMRIENHLARMMHDFPRIVCDLHNVSLGVGQERSHASFDSAEIVKAVFKEELPAGSKPPARPGISREISSV